MIAVRRNDMGMVWELKSVPYQTHAYGKDQYVYHSYWGKLRYGGNSPIPIPYQSIPAPQAMEKLWDYNGKDNLYP